MRDKITRKIAETEIRGFSVVMGEDNVPVVKPLAPVTVYGTVTEAQAMRELKKAYPDEKGVTLGKTETKEIQYEISVEDFVKNATKIEEKKGA